MARSRGAASGLYKEVTLDPAKYPVLRWSWKITGTIPKGNAMTKAGDDYAAQVYVGRMVGLTGPRGVVVPLWRYHENHMHVRLRPGVRGRRV